MIIEFLVEDNSGRILLEKIMMHYLSEHSEDTIKYNIYQYKGLGGFVKGKKPKEAKSDHLLNDLPKRMRAIQAKYLSAGDMKVSMFVVVDNDRREIADFRKELENTAYINNINMDHVFCIAVEEMEAWLLGDFAALKLSYPELSDRILSKHSGYIQDSICDTWEFLADILTKGGLKEFRKQNPTPYDEGRKKAEWAERIGENMDIRNNASPSFNSFIYEIDRRVK